MTGSEASPAKGLVVTTVRGDKRRCLGQRPKKRRFSRHFFPRHFLPRLFFFKKSEATCPRFSLCLNSNGFAVMERSTTLGSLLPSCSPLPPPPCLVLDRIPFIVIDREPNPRSTSSERKSEKPRHLHLSPGGMFSPPPDFERSVFPPSERKSSGSVLPLINRPLWEQGGAIKTGGNWKAYKLSGC